MRLGRAQIKHVLGWAGGVVERGEPDLADSDIRGRLRAGENFLHTSTSRLQVRGGARVALTLTGNDIDSIVGVYPWSPTGGLVVAHSSDGSGAHYGVAITEEGAVALPAGTPTESGSTDNLDWNSGTIVWPQAVELFETLFLCDPAGAQVMRSAKLVGGGLVTADVEADLDGDTTDGGIKATAVEQYNSVLLIAGWEDETVGEAGHIVRHSFLGQDPAASAGWDPEAFLIVGAQGQPVRAMRSGLGQCLVAKETELYRLTGYPDATPGWQLAIQQVEATLGFGCVNAHALEFAEGRWWGIGQNGPWVYDGSGVRSLRSARALSWSRVGDIRRAFVRYHPRRRAVLFGFDEPTAPVTGQRASRLWAYDLRSDSWAPDYTAHRRFWLVGAIAQTGAELDTNPSALTWQSVRGTFEQNAITFTFTPGDPTAQTEVWLEPSGGSEALVQTLSANQRGARLAGLEAGRRYRVRLRHRQGDALTEYSAPVDMYTQVPAPRLLGTESHERSIRSRIVVDRAARSAVYQVSADTNPVPVTVAVNLAAGVVDLPYPAAAVSFWTNAVDIALREPTHPGGFSDSPTVRYNQCSGQIITGLNTQARISQQFDPDSWRETTVTVVLDDSNFRFAGGASDRIVLQYRRFGDTDWIEFQQFPLGSWAGLGYGVGWTQVTVSGLTPGERYELRLVRLQGGTVSTYGTAVLCYTKIPTPAASIMAMGSPGSPSVNITARPGNGLTGFDLAIRNLAGTYDSLFSSVPSNDVVYNSTAGTCGAPDTYFVRARSVSWPAGLDYSDPVVLTVADPCTS